MIINNKNDILILRTLYKHEKINELQSSTISAITKILDNQFSSMKIRTTLYQFIKHEYVANGYKIGNSKTYYITSKGIVFLKNLIKGEIK